MAFEFLKLLLYTQHVGGKFFHCKTDNNKSLLALCPLMSGDALNQNVLKIKLSVFYCSHKCIVEELHGAANDF